MKRHLLVALFAAPLVLCSWAPSADASGFGRWIAPSSGGLIRAYAARVVHPTRKIQNVSEAEHVSHGQPVMQKDLQAKKLRVQPETHSSAQSTGVRPAQKRNLPTLQRWIAEQLGAFHSVVPALL